jgi:hypothetical protein
VAYAELYLVFVGTFRVYGSNEVQRDDDVGCLELLKTTADNVKLTKDVFIPVTPDGSKEVRIVVKN